MCNVLRKTADFKKFWVKKRKEVRGESKEAT
jgi:hypothetical protein